jgi:hypothetical protein
MHLFAGVSPTELGNLRPRRKLLNKHRWFERGPWMNVRC